VLKSRARAVALAVAFGLVALAVGGWQKYWQVIIHYTDEDRAAGRNRLAFPHVRLGTFLYRLATEDQSNNPHHRRNLINLGLVAGVPVVIGSAAFLVAAPRRRPDAAADYTEAQGQSVPDERGGP
jgi:hypothetical protein